MFIYFEFYPDDHSFKCVGAVFLHVLLSSSEDIVVVTFRKEVELLLRNVPNIGGSSLRVHVEWPDEMSVDMFCSVKLWQH